MRILIVHNYYQRPGGEDVVFQDERTLLEQAGHQIIIYERNNAEIASYSLLQKVTLLQRTIWARDSQQAISRILFQERPQVVHFHNTFPLISPAVYYTCREAHIPVVQTLHNYRLFCLNSLFLRDGYVCENCLSKIFPWPGVYHACYRNSHIESMVAATMLAFHRRLKTWHEKVDIYIALTEFSREKFIQGGLPEEKIVVKPNFLHPDPGVRGKMGDYVIFVGRLSMEKGIRTLLKAWRNLSNIPLKVVGDGPLMDEVKAYLQNEGLDQIQVLGLKSRSEVLSLMKESRFLIFPSEWYEGFPMTLLEAFACGVPVITSQLGGMAEIVEDGYTGLYFAPGNADELANKVMWLWSHSEEIRKMGQEARREFEAKYAAERNYEMLMEIYATVLSRR